MEARTGEQEPLAGSPCSDRQDTRSSLPPPAGLKGTRQDAREPLPGRPQRGGPRIPLQAHLPTLRSLQGRGWGWGWGGCWVTCCRPGFRMAPVGIPPNEDTSPSRTAAGFPHRPRDAAFRTHDSTYRPGRSARSTVLQGAGGDGGDPRACSGHSREGAGKRLRRGRAAALRELGHKGLCLQPEQRQGPLHGPHPPSQRRGDLRCAGLHHPLRLRKEIAGRAASAPAHLGGVPGVGGRPGPSIPAEKAVEDVNEQRVEGIHGSAGRQRARLRAAPRPRARTPRSPAAQPVRMLGAAAPTARLPRA